MDTYGSTNNGYRTFLSDTELVNPSGLWTFTDEDEASIDDAFFMVTMDDSVPFTSHPALRHGKAYNLSFADGHIETYLLKDQESWSSTNLVSSTNQDWIKLKSATTTK